jgi:hypothetical protein
MRISSPVDSSPAPSKTVSTHPAKLSDPERAAVVTKKATCPFIGSAVKGGALPVKNDAERPLASIDDVVKLGNTGKGSDLGQVLKVFAEGNHDKLPGPSGKLDQQVPPGLLSLDFPGSQGSHPGHSGILQGNPALPNSGRFSDADWARLASHADKDGFVSRQELGRFIGENLAKDPSSKVFDANVAKLLGQDALRTGADVVAKLEQKLTGRPDGGAGDKKLYEALTRTLGENNLIGSSGEYGLLCAFLQNSPKTQRGAGGPKFSMDDVKLMFKDKQLPPGWESWKKTSASWVENTTGLLVAAAGEYAKLEAKKSVGWGPKQAAQSVP